MIFRVYIAIAEATPQSGNIPRIAMPWVNHQPEFSTTPRYKRGVVGESFATITLKIFISMML